MDLSDESVTIHKEMMDTKNESRFDPNSRSDGKSAGIRCGLGESVFDCNSDQIDAGNV